MASNIDMQYPFPNTSSPKGERIMFKRVKKYFSRIFSYFKSKKVVYPAGASAEDTAPIPKAKSKDFNHKEFN